MSGNELLTLPELPLSRARLHDYFDVWAIERRRGSALRDLFAAMDWSRHLNDWEARQTMRDAERAASGDGKAGRGFQTTAAGVAVISLSGSLMKQASSGDDGTSTVEARRAVRTAANDELVRGIMLVIDSPGGTVSGTAELADDVAKANAIKPVWAYCEDLCASAAYWIASQTGRIAANRTASIGSIGVYSVVHDMSKMAANEGIVVHVLHNDGADLKGAGVPGTEITEAQLAEWRKRINGVAEHFIGAVAAGRKLSKSEAAQLATGQVWSAAEAVDLKLIDAVETLDDTLAAMGKRIERVKQERGRTMSKETNEGPVAATLSELKAACPGANADFLVAQQEKNATAAQASHAWMTQLAADKLAAEERATAANAKAAEAEKARVDAETKAAAATAGAKPRGVDPLRENAGGGAGDTGGDVRAIVNDRVEAKVKSGMVRSEAMRAVFREDPQLRERFNAEHNAEHRTHTKV